MFPTSFAQLLLRLVNMNDCWNEILPECEKIDFPRGKIIPSTPDRFYFLDEGLIKTSFATSNGLEWIFLYQKKGCLFNENSVLRGRSKFLYTCQTKARVHILPASMLSNMLFIKKYPYLYINLLETLALKEAICHAYMSDLAYATSRGRVCQALLALCKEHEGMPAFAPEITQSEIASMMGLHQTTVARIVRQLRDEGIISSFTKKKLEIRSFPRLEELAKELAVTSESPEPGAARLSVELFCPRL